MNNKMSLPSSEILFEKFQVIETLKKDEHAGVYLANHIYLSKKIILKVLNTQKIPDPAIIERFKREAKILAKLDHPNIIKVLDFGMSKEFFYISFEYIEGESLRNVFKTKNLTQDQKEHLMIQLLQGLNYAHKCKIIHRDIKPENIFIDKNLNVKLGDFGLALSSDDNFVTNPYSIVGTPSYMSPEQIQGTKLTEQSDLFSAGVVLFELYTGMNPFLRDNVSLTLNEIISHRDDSFDEKLISVPDNIKTILNKLLKKNINQRYKTAAEILELLNVPENQPTLIIDNNGRESIKSKLIWMALGIIVVITVGIVVESQYKKQNISDQAVVKEIKHPADDLSKKSNNSVKQQNQTIEIQPDQNKTDPQTNNLMTNNQYQNSSAESAAKTIKYGGLFVECLPWAEVYINGEKFETTPLSRPIKLAEGEYTLKLVHPDYPIYTRIVEVKAEQVTNIRFSLDKLMGFLNCRVNPWGNIFVNGELKGQTPIQGLIKVVPGSVRLTIKNPNYKDIDTVFFIRANDTLRLKFSYKK
jgi:serine/threonine-protein kinase